MAEYIDREAVNRISFTDAVLIDGEVRIEKIALVRDIEKLPAADVAPVRHGVWERVLTSKNAAKWSSKVSCSVCHNAGYKRFNYCHNCGAKMDGGAEK